MPNNTQTKPITQIMLLADCSSSLSPCFDKLRSTVKNTYLALSKDYDVGVGVYAENFQKLSSPAPFNERTAELLDTLAPAYKSDLRCGLYQAADCFDLSNGGEKHLLVFTDGGFDGDEPYTAADELADAGIKLHAIGFSGHNNCFDDALSRLTGGAFVHSFDASSYIDSVFKKHPSHHHSCSGDICITAEIPCFKPFRKINVHLQSGCGCAPTALCVKLMLGDKLISEKYVSSPTA